VKKFKMAKVIEPLVLYPHSPEHPAQTDKISVDKPIAEVLEQEWSSLITPAQKGEMLERCEELRRAIKTATQRANSITVENSKTVGKQIFDYIIGPE
jgi:hypothetical protein